MLEAGPVSQRRRQDHLGDGSPQLEYRTRVLRSERKSLRRERGRVSHSGRQCRALVVGDGREGNSIHRAGECQYRSCRLRPWAGASTTELRQGIVEQYIAAGVVPMVDYHNGTCETDPALVSAAVDLWLGPDKAWLQKYERSVMLNITNEWGADNTQWRDTYISAVTRLRQGGVNNLVVIDAGGNCGQNAHSIETWANDIFAADPQKNVVFSIHMYGFWHNPGSSDVGKWDGQQPYDLDLELKRLVATGLPIIVGEFTTESFSDVGYTSRVALSTYEKNGVGWLAWDWSNPADNRSNIVKTDVYNSSADLTPFGELIVNDPSLGLMANARKATIF